jgi:hypothetical protein
MAHLIINPETPGAWAVQLKEGENSIGRAEDNDVRIEEGGVSGHHCKVILERGAVTIFDLNSTNGTHLNGARVAQGLWAPGQIIHLGEMPVRLDGLVRLDAPLAAPVATLLVASADPPVAAAAPAPTTASKGPIRLQLPNSAKGAALPPVATAPDAPLPPPLSLDPVAAPAGTACRSHPKSHARWYCPKCRKFFCEVCVATRARPSGSTHMCRSCGSECHPVQVEASDSTGERGFFARLPGSFLYPLRGAGILVLIVATIVFAALGMVAGIFSIAITMMAIGYLFLFLQNIIHCTAAGDDEMPSMPDFDGLFGAFFTLAGTMLFCFCLPVGLLIAKLCAVDIPTSALVGSSFLCSLYFPMAFLAVAMNDSVMAVNPMVVVPAILKVPGQYLITVILLCGVFGVRLLGDSLSSVAGDITFETRDMSVMFLSFAFRALWAFLSIYLLTVGMRILGILYVTQKEKLGWF